jgi:hypothetical protein
MPLKPPSDSTRLGHPLWTLKESDNVAHIIGEILSKISYKPGWKLTIVENPNIYGGIYIRCTYVGYESVNAAFDPIFHEPPQASRARERIAISLGKSVRERKRFFFTRSFDEYSFRGMDIGAIIQYVIGDTIKQAEMYEFERWFKYEGVPVFENKGEDKP